MEPVVRLRHLFGQIEQMDLAFVWDELMTTKAVYLLHWVGIKQVWFWILIWNKFAGPREHGALTIESFEVVRPLTGCECFYKDGSLPPFYVVKRLHLLIGQLSWDVPSWMEVYVLLLFICSVCWSPNMSFTVTWFYKELVRVGESPNTNGYIHRTKGHLTVIA